MHIHPFTFSNINAFLHLSATEGWISDRREIEFLLKTFPQGCFVSQNSEGETVGFVTSIAYDRSGWIGNLLVRSDQRGQGVGPRLFAVAIDALKCAGVRTIWLTASRLGKPIYEKIGFRTITTIERWRGVSKTGAAPVFDTTSIDVLVPIDEAGWGDRRISLLEQSIVDDRVLFRDKGFLALRQYQEFTQLGPWGAPSASSARSVFADALSVVGEGRQVVADVPSANHEAGVLLKYSGFEIVGENDLMYAGEAPATKLSFVYSLASMGSFG